MKKVIHILKTLSSMVIWGFGQLLNRQYLKALFFFVPFSIFLLIELSTGNYFAPPEPYQRVPGLELNDKFFVDFGVRYQYDTRLNPSLADPDFDAFLGENTVDGELNYSKEVFTDFLVEHMKKYSPTQYTDLKTGDVIGVEDDNAPLSGLRIAIMDVIYRNDETGKYYSLINTGGANFRYIELANPWTGERTNTFLTDGADELITVTKSDEIYFDSTSNKAYLKVSETDKDDITIEAYIDLFTNEKTSALPGGTRVDNSRGPIVLEGNEIYQYYQAGIVYPNRYIQYNSTKVTNAWQSYCERYFGMGIAKIYTEDDFLKYFLEVYFKLNPTEEKAFLSRYSNFFGNSAGLFLRGYWSIITLGTAKPTDFRQFGALQSTLYPKDVSFVPAINVQGEISTKLLLEGLIGVIIHLTLLIFMAWSMVDAYRVSVRRAEKKKVASTKEYFKDVYESSFEYIVLSPAMFVLALITVMPIIFGILMAFTSISGSKSYAEIFDWVGIKNFIAIFDFNSDLGSTYGKAFWRVLGWTFIWAIFSTVTCFFGGFVQALFLNSEHVVFRKFWRTILILPWAVPALLSQMVFRIIFQGQGFVNKTLDGLGITKLLHNVGFLGRSYNDDIAKIGNPIEKFFSTLFYLGKDNIEWFNNAHNFTFTRIVLIVINLWLGFPYFMALMTGIMTSIDRSLYEAAEIDGASKWQQLTKITVPLVLYATAPILIMTFSGNFNNFGVIYFITGGGYDAGNQAKGYAGATDILISWMYNLTVEYSIFNMASVFSVLIFIVVGSISAWNLSRTRAFKED